ncbi:MAG: hypothetical protein KDD94_12235 [Calditrichaeota bacterium]|nr:hypothetical protein [Calditrichota bacterium]
MNLKKISNRLVLYFAILLSLHFFSQILLDRFATYYLLAYIIAAINGFLTVETYYILMPVKGLLFVRLFWLAYLFRILILIAVLIYNAIGLGKGEMSKFFAAFFVYYYVWLILEITILVKEKRTYKTKRVK